MGELDYIWMAGLLQGMKGEARPRQASEDLASLRTGLLIYQTTCNMAISKALEVK